MRILTGALCALMLFMVACNEAPAEEKSQQEETPTFDVAKATKEYQAAKAAFEQAEKANSLKHRFRQEIGLELFNQEEVDISEIELWYDGQQAIRLNTRFQNIIPMGGKYWYIQTGPPLAVEVYKSDQDEEANVIEIPMYTLLLDPTGENHQFINVEAEISEELRAKLIEENIQEWKDVQQWIEKYRPKDEE